MWKLFRELQTEDKLNVLRAIKENEGQLKVSDLAKKLNLSLIKVSNIARSLHSVGLIDDSKYEGRAIYYTLSSKGLRLMKFIIEEDKQ